MLHTPSKQQRLVINKSFSKIADKFEAFEMLSEEIDIERDVEVEEKEVKGYDDYEETEFITEDFIDLDTLDYVDKNVMSALEEHLLGIPQLTFVDEARISRVKEDRKVNLTKSFYLFKVLQSVVLREGNTLKDIQKPVTSKSKRKSNQRNVSYLDEEGYEILSALAIFSTYQPGRSWKYPIQGFLCRISMIR